MSQTPILTILVTTYNRAFVLDALLNMLTSYQERGLTFNILVSDDCSSDNTSEICSKWASRLQGFKHISTERNLGMDNNFKNVYENFDTEYCWLLGDTRHISYEALKEVIDTLATSKYDALILRCREEMPQQHIVYSDIDTLMKEQGWHITNNASCVIPRRFVNPALYHRYMGTTFLHMGIFVENLCQMEHFNVLYMGDVYITELDVVSFNKVGWTKHPFLNFGKLWYEFVMSLPNQIEVDRKHFVLKEHNRRTGIFSLSGIHRQILTHGKVYIDSYRENRRYMKYVTDQPLLFYDILITVIPRKFYTFLFAVYKLLFKRKKSEAR